MKTGDDLRSAPNPAGAVLSVNKQIIKELHEVRLRLLDPAARFCSSAEWLCLRGFKSSKQISGELCLLHTVHLYQADFYFVGNLFDLTTSDSWSLISFRETMKHVFLMYSDLNWDSESLYWVKHFHTAAEPSPEVHVTFRNNVCVKQDVEMLDFVCSFCLQLNVFVVSSLKQKLLKRLITGTDFYLQ